MPGNHYHPTEFNGTKDCVTVHLCMWFAVSFCLFYYIFMINNACSRFKANYN